MSSAKKQEGRVDIKKQIEEIDKLIREKRWAEAREAFKKLVDQYEKEEKKAP